jgi:hypothetical protein
MSVEHKVYELSLNFVHEQIQPELLFTLLHYTGAIPTLNWVPIELMMTALLSSQMLQRNFICSCSRPIESIHRTIA